jgi:hypothetical protein
VFAGHVGSVSVEVVGSYSKMKTSRQYSPLRYSWQGATGQAVAWAVARKQSRRTFRLTSRFFFFTVYNLQINTPVADDKWFEERA